MSDDKRVALHMGLITVLTDIERVALETMGIKTTGEVTNNDELIKLKKELQQVQLENEILKKAVAIFSKEQKIK